GQPAGVAERLDGRGPQRRGAAADTDVRGGDRGPPRGRRRLRGRTDPRAVGRRRSEGVGLRCGPGGTEAYGAGRPAAVHAGRGRGTARRRRGADQPVMSAPLAALGSRRRGILSTTHILEGPTVTDPRSRNPWRAAAWAVAIFGLGVLLGGQ